MGRRKVAKVFIAAVRVAVGLVGQRADDYKRLFILQAHDRNCRAFHLAGIGVIVLLQLFDELLRGDKLIARCNQALEGMLLANDRNGGLIGELHELFIAVIIYARLIAKIDVIVAHYGFLRALAGIGLGIFLGAVTEAVAGRNGAYGADKTQMKELPKGLAPAANLLLLGITVYYQFGVRSLWDFVVIGLFFAALLCMLPGENGWLSRFEGPIRRLSKLTYPVYLFQLPVLTLIAYLAGQK